MEIHTYDKNPKLNFFEQEFPYLVENDGFRHKKIKFEMPLLINNNRVNILRKKLYEIAKLEDDRKSVISILIFLTITQVVFDVSLNIRTYGWNYGLVLTPCIINLVSVNSVFNFKKSMITFHILLYWIYIIGYFTNLTIIGPKHITDNQNNQINQINTNTDTDLYCQYSDILGINTFLLNLLIKIIINMKLFLIARVL